MDEATKKKLKEAGLEGVVTAFETQQAELTAAQTKIKESETLIAQKDAIIAQKTEDIVGARRETQKLKELSAEESAKMSEKEIELHNATLALQKRQEEFENMQRQNLQKEVDARKERVIARIAGKDPELKKKVEENYKKIVDHDKAQTDEEIEAVAVQGFNMLGIPRSNPITDVVGGGGDGTPGGAEGNGFSDSGAGKDLATAMGLQQTQPQQTPPPQQPAA